jgi:membrane protein
MPREAWTLIQVAFWGWWNDRAMSMGAAVAFYAVFSLAPMLLTVIAVAGLVFGREAAQGAIVAEIGGLIGVNEAAAVEGMVASAGEVKAGIIGTIVGAVTFLLVATGAFVELQDDLNIIWKAKPSEQSGVVLFLRTRLLSFALVIAIGFLLLISLVIDAGLSAIGGYLSAFFSGLAFLAGAVNFAVSLAVSTLLFALIFKVLPDVLLDWHDVWFGAVTTALLFALGKFLIGFYLGRSGVATTYGAAASVITLLLWIFYSSQILLFGAELTKAYAERRGSRSPAAPPRLPDE